MKKKLGQKINVLREEAQRIKSVRGKYEAAFVTLNQRY